MKTIRRKMRKLSKRKTMRTVWRPHKSDWEITTAPPGNVYVSRRNGRFDTTRIPPYSSRRCNGNALGMTILHPCQHTAVSPRRHAVEVAPRWYPLFRSLQRPPFCSTTHASVWHHYRVLTTFVILMWISEASGANQHSKRSKKKSRRSPMHTTAGDRKTANCKFFQILFLPKLPARRPFERFSYCFRSVSFPPASGHWTRGP